MILDTKGKKSSDWKVWKDSVPGGEPPMPRQLRRRLRRMVPFVAALVSLTFQTTLTADSVERTSVHVLVKDAETGQPIQHARLTLEFREPGSKPKLKRSKLLAFSAKTNPQGRYRFTNIPKGTIRLVVTAERHQSFGKEIELEQDNQVIEIALKKPQPLL